MNKQIIIPFHNQTVLIIEHEGASYVAMRPIVENMGLAWSPQHIKLIERFGRRVTMIVTRDTLGRKQELVCLPLSKLAGFLYSINHSKVKPELRDLIITYQDECDEVLFNHFIRRNQAEHNAYSVLLEGIYAKHPLWRETMDLFVYGFTQQQIAEMQGRHKRNVQRMLRG